MKLGILITILSGLSGYGFTPSFAEESVVSSKAPVQEAVVSEVSPVDTVAKADCFYKAETLYDGKSEHRLPEDCFDIAVDMAKGHEYDLSVDGKVLAISMDNLIQVQYNTSEGINRYHVTGPASELVDISSISLDVENKEVYVVNQNPFGLYAFEADVSGNISARRRLKGEHIKGASKVHVNNHKNEIAVTFPEEGKVKIFRREADDWGRRDKNKTTPVRTFEGILTGIEKPIDVASSTKGKYLYVLDGKKNKIFIFKWDKGGDVLPIVTIGGDKSQLENAVTLSVDEENKIINVRKAGGEIVKLAFGSKGNSTPIGPLQKLSKADWKKPIRTPSSSNSDSKILDN